MMKFDSRQSTNGGGSAIQMDTDIFDRRRLTVLGTKFDDSRRRKWA